jgi:hypothetical protein
MYREYLQKLKINYCKSQLRRIFKFLQNAYDITYLLTAIGLSPGGSRHLQTNNT